jgi:glycosyltransferase involved in cell wall biosynthesis
MCAVNQHMKAHFPDSIIINTSTNVLTKTMRGTALKACRVVFGLCRMLVMLPWISCAYVALSGGWGQVYELLFIVLARLSGKELFIHHHSYAYLIAKSALTKLVMITAGPATHIVACDKMALDLRRIYPAVTNTRVVSGVIAIDACQRPVPRRGSVRIIGFLSNITEDKGIIEFLSVAKEIRGVRARIAGPFQSDGAMKAVKDSGVEYLGPVYGEAKYSFLDSIDVLLFPTKYRNESEGLVIHEAMSRGVPVIANGRGCIRQVISDHCGLVVTGDYVSSALILLNQWVSSPGAFNSACIAARTRFEMLSANAAIEFHELKESMSRRV